MTSGVEEILITESPFFITEVADKYPEVTYADIYKYLINHLDNFFTRKITRKGIRGRRPTEYTVIKKHAEYNYSKIE